jgi:hypothetical protein
MVFYWQKRLLAEHFGETTVRVECNNCGREYFYELRRVGAGSEVAPFFVGTGRAARTALDQSQRDLSRRLASEAELVPCPACNWINEDLVRGYRRGRFRRLTTIAFCIGFFGTAGSLIAAGYLLKGPAADQKLLPYFLYGGPALSISLAATFVLLRVGLRSLIRPNRNFPRPPKVPRGTPPALRKDPQTGKLKPANREDQIVHSTGDWQEFRLGRDEFPPICCVCGRAAQDGSAYKCDVSKVSAIEIPRCGECAKRATRKSWLIKFLIIVPTLCVTSAVAFAMGLDAIQISLVTLFALIPLVFLAEYVGPWATAPVRLSGRHLSRGIARLRFHNRGYAQLFANHIRDSSAAQGPP